MLVLGSVFRRHCLMHLIVYYYFEIFNLFLYFVGVLMQKREKKNKEKIFRFYVLVEIFDVMKRVVTSSVLRRNFKEVRICWRFIL